jgi:hypothetical protein
MRKLTGLFFLALTAFAAGAINNKITKQLSTYTGPGSANLTKLSGNFWGQSLVSGLIILVAIGVSGAVLGIFFPKPHIPGTR